MLSDSVRVLQVFAIITGGLSFLQAKDNAPRSEQAFIGRWDVTVSANGGMYPSWFEIRKSGYSTLVGGYVAQFGSVRPISKVNVNGAEMSFTVPPQFERRADDVTYKGKLEGDVIRGETTDDQGKRVTWEARRAPSLDREKAPVWGKPVELFNGKNLDGWKPRDASKKNGWKVENGVLVNAEPGNDLITEKLFTDFKLNAEFRYPKGSNSGIYLRGRYELQIEDNFGGEADSHRIGGVYGFLTPRVNAAKPSGEWQAVEITLVGRRVSLVFNGENVIDRQVIPGITGGALDSDEAKPGPILIQGDHGPVEFRKVVIVAAE